MIHIVVGAGFGDEGKGQTVAEILNSQASPSNYVIRFNGGHQAGHTVEHDGKRHVFSNFCAGTLHGVKSYWSQHCTIHPMGILNELKVLNKLGVEPVLHIDPFCPVTTPFDIECNHAETKHGTVGVGFGDTIQRQEDHFRIHAMDLLSPDVLYRKLELLQRFYYQSSHLACTAAENFYKDCQELLQRPGIQIMRPQELGDHPIFEGAQGILLDKEFGFFPHVTRSKCTAANAIHEIMRFKCLDDITINYVSRSYHTRHGMGPFTTVPPGLVLKENLVETNVNNDWQGEFRKSILDMDLLTYALRCSEVELSHFPAVRTLNFTCIDHHQKPNFYVMHNNIMKLVDEEELQTIGDEILQNV